MKKRKHQDMLARKVNIGMDIKTGSESLGSEGDK